MVSPLLALGMSDLIDEKHEVYYFMSADRHSED